MKERLKNNRGNMFKWKIHATAKAKAKPSDVWKIWTDVEAWPKWDHELEWSSLSGPFKVGTEGQLKPKGWFASKFCIISMEEGKAHSDRTQMPFTSVVFSHIATPCEESQVQISHSVEVSGLLAPILWLTMRFSLKKGLPQAVERLARIAEEQARKN